MLYNVVSISAIQQSESYESENVSHSIVQTLIPHGSSVLGVLQAKILEWVAIPFFRRSP